MKEKLEFLAKDEEEAIKGYDDVIAELGDKPIVKQLKKIRDEEVAHLEFLRKAKENPDLEYVDLSDGDNDGATEILKSKLDIHGEGDTLIIAEKGQLDNEDAPHIKVKINNEEFDKLSEEFHDDEEYDTAYVEKLKSVFGLKGE